MTIAMINLGHAAPSCLGEGVLIGCAVTDMAAMTLLERSEVVAELWIGSAALTLVVDPDLPEGTAPSLLIRSSTGEAAVIPSDFFALLR